MSKTTLYDVHADGKAHVIIAGRFEGGTPPLYPIANPPGWTVARTSSGIYTITFADQYAAFISCVVSLEATVESTADGWTVMTSTYTDGANPTLVVTTNPETGTTVGDLPAATFINFIAVFRNTTVAQ